MRLALGLLSGVLGVSAYLPRDASSCCLAKCDSTRNGAADCAAGCHYWMKSSSLNWEGAEWHTKLERQCLKDCGEWKHKRVGHLAMDPPGRVRHCDEDFCGVLAGDFTEHEHPFAGTCPHTAPPL